MPVVPWTCKECGDIADKPGRAKGMCRRCYHRMARKKWSVEHLEQERAKSRAWHLAHAAERNSQTLRRRREQRAKVTAMLGGKCACCGETEPIFLTLDHVQNDGHRDRMLARHLLLKRVEREGYPKDRYQILCWNCNAAKAMGGCPHRLASSPRT